MSAVGQSAGRLGVMPVSVWSVCLNYCNFQTFFQCASLCQHLYAVHCSFPSWHDLTLRWCGEMQWEFLDRLERVVQRLRHRSVYYRLSPAMEVDYSVHLAGLDLSDSLCPVGAYRNSNQLRDVLMSLPGLRRLSLPRYLNNIQQAIIDLSAVSSLYRSLIHLSFDIDPNSTASLYLAPQLTLTLSSLRNIPTLESVELTGLTYPLFVLDDVIRAWATALPRLTRLVLSECHISDAIVCELPTLSSLQHVGLRECFCYKYREDEQHPYTNCGCLSSAAVADALCRCPSLTSLAVGSRLGEYGPLLDEGLLSGLLQSSDRWMSLELMSPHALLPSLAIAERMSSATNRCCELSLQCSCGSERSPHANLCIVSQVCHSAVLSTLPRLHAVEQLTLGSSHFDASCLLALGRLPRLRLLYLSSFGPRNNRRQHVAEQLDQLNILIQRDSVHSSPPLFVCLSTIVFETVHFARPSCLAVLRCFPRLVALTFVRCKLTDSHAMAISSACGTRLLYLHISEDEHSGCYLSFPGIRALLGPLMIRLTVLELGSACGISLDSVALLERRRVQSGLDAVVVTVWGMVRHRWSDYARIPLATLIERYKPGWT